jgi:hypothetical protein
LAADEIRGSPPEDTGRTWAVSSGVGRVAGWEGLGAVAGAVALWMRRVQGKPLVRVGGCCLAAFNCIGQNHEQSFSGSVLDLIPGDRGSAFRTAVGGGAEVVAADGA